MKGIGNNRKVRTLLVGNNDALFTGVKPEDIDKTSLRINKVIGIKNGNSEIFTCLIRIKESTVDGKQVMRFEQELKKTPIGSKEVSTLVLKGSIVRGILKLENDVKYDSIKVDFTFKCKS